MHSRYLIKVAILIASGVFIYSSNAWSKQESDLGGISLNRTRIIFQESGKPQALEIENSGNRRFIIRTQIQEKAGNSPSRQFAVTPPMLALSPDSMQQLRIFLLDHSLPTDRESMFMISVLAIPSVPEKNLEESDLYMGMQFFIKLIYRPKNLKEKNDATCSLNFKSIKNGIQVENKSPYFQTIASLRSETGNLRIEHDKADIPPFGSRFYTFKEKPKEVFWRAVTDNGGLGPTCTENIEYKMRKP